MLKQFYSSFSVFVIILILTMTFLAGCFSVKPGAIKSGKNLYESFYVGDQGTQYFIKPLKFENDKNGYVFLVDFTFQYKDDLSEIVTVNFSLISDTKPDQPDSLIIKSKGNRIAGRDIKSLYRQKKSQDFVFRYTTEAKLENLHKLMESNQWQVKIYNARQNLKYSPKRKTQKNIEKLYQNVFVLLVD